MATKITAQPNIADLFAYGGDYNSVPQTKQTSGGVSLAEGFPAETSKAPAQGGVPPQRADMNGILRLFSQFCQFQQSGGSFVWSAERDYIAGCEVLGSDGAKYRCIKANGLNYPDGAKDPVSNSYTWADTAGSNYWLNLDSVKSVGGSVPVGAVFPAVREPDNTGAARYIKLSYNDGYNSGLLTYGTPGADSGSPHMNYTATVSLASSPLKGSTVRLINSEKRYLRAGENGTVYNDAIRNITGSSNALHTLPIGVSTTGTGALQATVTYDGAIKSHNGGTESYKTSIDLDASKVVPTADENRVRTLEIEYYMRIL